MEHDMFGSSVNKVKLQVSSFDAGRALFQRNRTSMMNQAGNSMNTHMIGHALLWILSCTRRRDSNDEPFEGAGSATVAVGSSSSASSSRAAAAPTSAQATSRSGARAAPPPAPSSASSASAPSAPTRAASSSSAHGGQKRSVSRGSDKKRVQSRKTLKITDFFQLASTTATLHNSNSDARDSKRPREPRSSKKQRSRLSTENEPEPVAASAADHANKLGANSFFSLASGKW